MDELEQAMRAYECKFTVEASGGMLSAQKRIAFDGYASTEIMYELAAAIRCITGQSEKKEAASDD
jgi:hypothetical protein